MKSLPDLLIARAKPLGKQRQCWRFLCSAPDRRGNPCAGNLGEAYTDRGPDSADRQTGEALRAHVLAEIQSRARDPSWQASWYEALNANWFLWHLRGLTRTPDSHYRVADLGRATRDNRRRVTWHARESPRHFSMRPPVWATDGRRARHRSSRPGITPGLGPLPDPAGLIHPEAPRANVYGEIAVLPCVVHCPICGRPNLLEPPVVMWQ